MNTIKKIYRYIKDKLHRFWHWIFGGAVLAVATMAVLGAVQTPLPTYSELNWVRPNTNADWKIDVEKEGLNTRYDYQLVEMDASHEAKLLEEKKEYDLYVRYPDKLRGEIWVELDYQGLNPTSRSVETLFTERMAEKKLSVDMLNRAVERITNEMRLRASNFVDRTQDLRATKPSTERERTERAKL